MWMPLLNWMAYIPAHTLVHQPTLACLFRSFSVSMRRSFLSIPILWWRRILRLCLMSTSAQTLLPPLKISWWKASSSLVRCRNRQMAWCPPASICKKRLKWPIRMSISRRELSFLTLSWWCRKIPSPRWLRRWKRRSTGSSTRTSWTKSSMAGLSFYRWSGMSITVMAIRMTFSPISSSQHICAF